MAVENGAMYHVPTLRERAWRRLGFRYHLGVDPEGIDTLPGWMCTENRLDFSMADRLRILISGRLRISIKHHMPVQPDFSKNRLDWYILQPGERR